MEVQAGPPRLNDEDEDDLVPAPQSEEVAVAAAADAVATGWAPRPARVCKADMSEDMTQDAVDCAAEALRQFTVQRDIAQFIKKEFDAKYNPKWHVIVGKHFGSYVSFEPVSFVYFFVDDLAFLIWKSNE